MFSSLSSQAKTLLVIQIIQIVIVTAAILMAPITTTLYKVTSLVATLLVMVLSTWFYVKSVNCMVNGDCGTFAWIIVGTLLLLFVMSVVGSMTSYIVKKDLKLTESTLKIKTVFHDLTKAKQLKTPVLIPAPTAPK